MKKYIYISLFALTSAFTACSSLEESGVAEAVPFDGQNIRLHTTIGGGTRIDVPSDNKTDWKTGDAIFFLVDGGSGDKGFKATYDGAKWSFAEWFKNGGTQDFNPAGGTVSFAMNGDNLDLATLKPSTLDVSKTALQTLTSYAGGKIGDLLFTNSGSYTVDENGVVDIFLTFTRPMAKIHIKGAYLAATQIRNHKEGTMPGGVDNAGGTNANYNDSKSKTLRQIIRYQPSADNPELRFRDANSGNGLNGTANMVYETRPEDAQIIDAVYYGNMDPDENGDLTIVMCVNARTYPGVEQNAALGKSGQMAYWRKFPGKSIRPGDNIYIYGPMSDEEAHLWTSQAITAEMNFTTTQLDLTLNREVELKEYCKWKTPAPTNRELTFESGTPSIISISKDGKTLKATGLGSTILKAKTIDGIESTMTVIVK